MQGFPWNSSLTASIIDYKPDWVSSSNDCSKVSNNFASTNRMHEMCYDNSLLKIHFFAAYSYEGNVLSFYFVCPGKASAVDTSGWLRPSETV